MEFHYEDKVRHRDSEWRNTFRVGEMGRHIMQEFRWAKCRSMVWCLSFLMYSHNETISLSQKSVGVADWQRHYSGQKSSSNIQQTINEDKRFGQVMVRNSSGLTENDNTDALGVIKSGSYSWTSTGILLCMQNASGGEGRTVSPCSIENMSLIV